MRNLCFGPECTISGYEVAKHPFYSIGTKMMFGSVSEHFANFQHVKRCKTCVSGLNALFRGTEVATHPFYSIGTKMMFESVSNHFANLWDVKDAKFVFEPECTISGYQSWEASILVHSTQNDVWECCGAFRKPSAPKKMQNLCSSMNALFRGTKVVKHPF